jgi:hypothetical protein
MIQEFAFFQCLAELTNWSSAWRFVDVVEAEVPFCGTGTASGLRGRRPSATWPESSTILSATGCGAYQIRTESPIGCCGAAPVRASRRARVPDRPRLLQGARDKRPPRRTVRALPWCAGTEGGSAGPGPAPGTPPTGHPSRSTHEPDIPRAPVPRLDPGAARGPSRRGIASARSHGGSDGLQGRRYADSAAPRPVPPEQPCAHAPVAGFCSSDGRRAGPGTRRPAEITPFRLRPPSPPGVASQRQRTGHTIESQLPPLSDMPGPPTCLEGMTQRRATPERAHDHTGRHSFDRPACWRSAPPHWCASPRRSPMPT